MTGTIAFVRLLPWSRAGGLAAAFAEILLAAVVLSGSVVAGHHLREWRAWYWDPATTHPWSPTPVPSEAAGATTYLWDGRAHAGR